MQPREGDPFQVQGRRDVLEIDVVEWMNSRAAEAPGKRPFFVVRTSAGDRYVLIPLEQPVLDVRWLGVPLRR